MVFDLMGVVSVLGRCGCIVLRLGVFPLGGGTIAIMCRSSHTGPVARLITRLTVDRWAKPFRRRLVEASA